MRSNLKKFIALSILCQLFLTAPATAQISNIIDGDVLDDDMQVGGDIFSDFTEDIEESQITEHERYYRYGRFFAFNIGLGFTTFDGNRGLAYENENPTYTLYFTFFQNFQSAFTLGFAFSKHSFFLPDATIEYRVSSEATTSGIGAGPGMVDVSMLRTFCGIRHYIDTSNLGTAITWSNPYLAGRLEYWYTTNKFIDQKNSITDDSGGGFGFALGFGLEFPVKLKENYIGFEVLYHTVAFHDKYSQAYRPFDDNGTGYEDLDGSAYTTLVSYVINW